MSSMSNTIQVIVRTFSNVYGHGHFEGVFDDTTSIGDLREWVLLRFMPHNVDVQFTSRDTILSRDNLRLIDVVEQVLMRGGAYVVYAFITKIQIPDNDAYAAESVFTTRSASRGMNSRSMNTRTAGEQTENTLVALGSFSQYSWGEIGRSACTAIALRGTLEILLKNEKYGPNLGLAQDALSQLNASFIDNILREGVLIAEKWRSKSGNTEHSSVQELLSLLDDTDEVRMHLNCLGEEFGMIDRTKSETIFGFRSTLESNMGKCCVLTKSPESILIFVGIGESPSYIFDSHPRPPLIAHAHLLKFNSIIDLCNALSSLFPWSQIEAENLYESMINMWQMTFFALMEQSSQPVTDSFEQSLVSESRSSIQEFSICQLFSTSEDLFPISSSEREYLTCPISRELFLDPVLASDGSVYERESIETHFKYEIEKIQTDYSFNRSIVFSPVHRTPMNNTIFVHCSHLLLCMEKYVSSGRFDEAESYEWKSRRDKITLDVSPNSSPNRHLPKTTKIEKRVDVIHDGWLILRSYGNNYFGQGKETFFCLNENNLVGFEDESKEMDDPLIFPLDMYTTVNLKQNRLELVTFYSDQRAKARIILDSEHDLRVWLSKINYVLSLKNNVKIVLEDHQNNCSSFRRIAIRLCSDENLVSKQGTGKCMITSCLNEFSKTWIPGDKSFLNCRRCGRIVCSMCAGITALSLQDYEVENQFEFYKEDDYYEICFECFEDSIEILENMALSPEEDAIRKSLVVDLSEIETEQIERYFLQNKDKINQKFRLRELRKSAKYTEIFEIIQKHSNATSIGNNEEGLDSIPSSNIYDLSSEEVFLDRSRSLTERIHNLQNRLQQARRNSEQLEITLEISKLTSELEEEDLQRAIELSHNNNFGKESTSEEFTLTPLPSNFTSTRNAAESLRQKIRVLDEELKNVENEGSLHRLSVEQTNLMSDLEEVELAFALEESALLEDNNLIGETLEKSTKDMCQEENFHPEEEHGLEVRLTTNRANARRNRVRVHVNLLSVLHRQEKEEFLLEFSRNLYRELIGVCETKNLEVLSKKIEREKELSEIEFFRVKTNLMDIERQLRKDIFDFTTEVRNESSSYHV